MSGEPKEPTAFAPRFKNLPTPATPSAVPGVPSAPSVGPSSAKVNASKRRTQIFLDLRKKSGEHFALAYAYLVAVGFDKRTITLEFTGYRVTMTGRNLEPIFRGIIAQVLGHVQEVDELADKATGDPKGSAVYGIGWEKV